MTRNAPPAGPSQRAVLNALSQGWLLRSTREAAQLERRADDKVVEFRLLTPERVERLIRRNWLTLLQREQIPHQERGVSYFTISNQGRLALC